MPAALLTATLEMTLARAGDITDDDRPYLAALAQVIHAEQRLRLLTATAVEAGREGLLLAALGDVHEPNGGAADLVRLGVAGALVADRLGRERHDRLTWAWRIFANCEADTPPEAEHFAPATAARREAAERLLAYLPCLSAPRVRRIALRRAVEQDEHLDFARGQALAVATQRTARWDLALALISEAHFLVGIHHDGPYAEAMATAAGEAVSALLVADLLEPRVFRALLAPFLLGD